MIFLFFLIIALITFFITLKTKMRKIHKEIQESDSKDVWAATGTFWKALIIPTILLIVGTIQPIRYDIVRSSHVGIKFNVMGNDRGIAKYEYKSGVVFYNSWLSNIFEFPTYQQHIDYDSQYVITKGGFPATIKPSFNYTLKPGEVGDMFQELRKPIAEIEQKWLYTAIIGAVNDVANKWAVDSIFNHRENFENDIKLEANKRVEKWFIVSQLRTNIVPPPSLVEAIQNKTNAIQNVQVAENDKLVEIALAQKKIAKARGDSADLVIHAAGKAEANRIESLGEADAIRNKQISLTPLYIQYLTVTNWDGKVSYVQGGNIATLLNIPSPK